MEIRMFLLHFYCGQGALSSLGAEFLRRVSTTADLEQLQAWVEKLIVLDNSTCKIKVKETPAPLVHAEKNILITQVKDLVLLENMAAVFKTKYRYLLEMGRIREIHDSVSM